jgi:predicted amidohydrolase YtcJ
VGPRPDPPSLLVRRAEVGGRVVDVRCADGVVTHVGATPDGADIVIDAAGGALLPGLHDHHIHLLAMAAARASVDLGPPAVTSPSTFDDTLRAASADGSGWLRGVGYHESVAGPLDRRRLDALVPDRPVRVQHRTGAAWVLNSAGLRATGFDDRVDEGVERDRDGIATGRLRRLDDALRAAIGGPPPDVAAVGRQLARYGVTAVGDLTPTEDRGDLELLATVAREASFPLAVMVTGGPALASTDVGLARGPVKIVLDEFRLPTLDELAAAMREARRAGRAIAVHCVTRVDLVLALAAWDDVGVVTGDRVEHGAVIPVELVAGLRDRGLVVVTQPSFVAARGDQYLADVDPDDRPHLWRCGSLLAAGIGVGGSSDAPFGDPDPWRAIAAARDRTTASGVVLGADERITARRALDLFITPLTDPAGPPRTVNVGAPADLCLLADPLDVALADPARITVATTVSRGHVVA